MHPETHIDNLKDWRIHLHRTKIFHQNDILKGRLAAVNAAILNKKHNPFELRVKDFIHERQSPSCLVVLVIKPEETFRLELIFELVASMNRCRALPTELSSKLMTTVAV